MNFSFKDSVQILGKYLIYEPKFILTLPAPSKKLQFVIMCTFVSCFFHSANCFQGSPYW